MLVIERLDGMQGVELIAAACSWLPKGPIGTNRYLPKRPILAGGLLRNALRHATNSECIQTLEKSIEIAVLAWTHSAELRVSTT